MERRFRLPASDPWASATWEGASLASLIEAANWSMAEKLAWLESATELAERLRRSRDRSPAPPGEPAPTHREP